MSRKKYYKIQPQKYQCLTIVIPKNYTSLQMTDIQHSYKPSKSLSLRKVNLKPADFQRVLFFLNYVLRILECNAFYGFRTVCYSCSILIIA